jgi:2-dehydro-3-deoxyphosphogluconate aldolase/(4S)-4-hydroxy-2-oxoglutarate aldolase
VNQQTAAQFIVAGASALGIGKDLIPQDAIELRQSERIEELAYRFLGLVQEGRADLAARMKRAVI